VPLNISQHHPTPTSCNGAILASRMQKIDQFLDRSDDFRCPAVLVLLSGDAGFDLAVRRAQSKRCHVEILYEHGAPPQLLHRDLV
jgi:hypothetical protein